MRPTGYPLSTPSASLAWFVRSSWRPFLLLFLLSFIPRFNELEHTPPEALMISAGRELGAIAVSLMRSGEFADPYALPTGPTAHLPPVYPFIVSLILRGFGLTPTAGFVCRLLIAITASVLFALLPWVAGQFGLTRQAGFLGGIAAALSKEEWHAHGEYLTGIVLALLLVAFLSRWTRPRVSGSSSLLLGIAAGAAFHLQPALLTVILGCFAFELWCHRSRRSLASLGVCALGIMLACLPWAWRNYTTFHAVFFIRSNLGLELRMGNHEGAAATTELMDAEPRLHYRHPTLLASEANRLRELGEAEYMRQAQREALAWITTHPSEFCTLTLQRLASLWGVSLGGPLATIVVQPLAILALLGLCRALPALASPQRAILIIPLAMYPMIYYFVAYMPRYRAPIDWILFILAGYVVWRGLEGAPSVPRAPLPTG